LGMCVRLVDLAPLIWFKYDFYCLKGDVGFCGCIELNVVMLGHHNIF
jgi:hypothetical protein